MKKRKTVAIVVMSVLVLVAVAVNWKYSLLNSMFPGTDDPPAESLPTGGNLEEDTYFDTARYTRTKAREETLALLNSVVNDENVDESVRENAYKEIVAYAKITEGEASLESVLKAKGFEDCIVYLTVDSATVVVAASELDGSQSAQIFDAVLNQTGFSGGAVRIVTYP